MSNEPEAADRPEEAELAERVRHGDVDAYAKLVSQNQDLALRVAYLITGDSAEAEDAAQDAFIKAFYRIRGFRPGSSFRAWLIRIVTNEARNRRRAAHRRAHLVTRSGATAPLPALATSPEGTVLAEERRQALLKALNNLREEDRLVIQYRYFFNFSEAEIAVALGCARGTVKSRLSRAMNRLRQRLGQDPELAGLPAVLPWPPAPDLAASVVPQLEPGGLGFLGSWRQSLRQHTLSLGIAGAAVAVAAAVFLGRAMLPSQPDAHGGEPLGQRMVVYGADLSSAERQEVAALLGAMPSDTAAVVTSDELDAALRSAGIEGVGRGDAISSTAVTCSPRGTGLHVRTANVTRMAAAAYAAALLPTGVVDVSVVVAAPSSNPVSGETAMIGALKGVDGCRVGRELEAEGVTLAYQLVDLMATVSDEGGDVHGIATALLKAAEPVLRGEARDRAAIEQVLRGADEQLPAAVWREPELVSYLEHLSRLGLAEYAAGYVLEANAPDEVWLRPTPMPG